VLVTACANTRLIPRTEVVVVTTDRALTQRVEKPVVPVKVNEDLDKKALRMEKALEECNARLADVEQAQELAIEKAKTIASPDEPAAPWWRRLLGGGK
jgi:hypothetical protein